jgi:hypothetical protein
LARWINQLPDADDPDGSEYLLSILDGRPSIYKEFAESYYEKKLDIHAIEHIYRHEVLTHTTYFSAQRRDHLAIINI